MKMLFFSADEKEVQQVGESFKQAGIHCEVRHSSRLPRSGQSAPEAELWIKDDRDCHRAFMLCVQLSIGFAKRPYVPSIFDVDAYPEETEENPQPAVTNPVGAEAPGTSNIQHGTFKIEARN